MTAVRVLPLSPASHVVHDLHGGDCAWPEKNCYVDVWIEVLHALGLEPAAMLGFTVKLDFEGDQWTFFKPSPGDLSTLYGIEVSELNVWRGDILVHAGRHLSEGKLVFTEADAYWLPDTQGSDYRRQHTKSTIVINALDVASRELGYFHNGGYHELHGEDFCQLFRQGFPYDPTFLPLFAEYARLDRIERPSSEELVRLAVNLLGSHLARAPLTNPVRRFAARFPVDLKQLQLDGLALYHGYAFATLRQLGSGFELAARHLQWLTSMGQDGLGSAQAAFLDISEGAKTLIMKSARAVNTRKPVDFSSALNEMAVSWDRAFDSLNVCYS